MKIVEWIATNGNETSSRTMWLGITGIMEKPEHMGILFRIPMDVHDFRSCLALVQQYNVTKEQLENIKRPFPWFAPILDNWDQLVSLYDRDPQLLYRKLVELRHECIKIDGYIQVRPSYWQQLSDTLTSSYEIR
jgi:hypothetical protein